MNPATAETTLLAPAPSSLRYMPGLDVVRGVAILMVLIQHGLATDVLVNQSHARFSLWSFANLGFLGVELFFVLSGFLITGILLDSRSTPDYFRNFYTRRALRIVPVYLLMVVVLRLTHSISWRYVAVCLLYLCNMSKLLGASPEYGPLWSLSVEEQFYIIWPFIVRKISRRSLFILCVALIFFTPVLRLALLYGPTFLRDTTFKTWDVADYFAAGGLIAIAVRSSRLRPLMHRAVAPLFLSGGLLCTIQYLYRAPLTGLSNSLFHATYLEPWLLLFSGFIVVALLHPGIASSPFARPLIFLAKISYGLYLCHPFVFRIIGTHWPIHTNTHFGPFSQLLLRFFAESAAAIAIATLSRYTFEQFFLRRKPRHQHAPRLHSVSPKIA